MVEKSAELLIGRKPPIEKDEFLSRENAVATSDTKRGTARKIFPSYGNPVIPKNFLKATNDLFVSLLL